MKSLGIKKTKVSIPLTDEEGSPRLTIDLSDKGISKKTRKFAALKERYDEIAPKVTEDADDEVKGEIIDLYREIVNGLCEEQDAWEQIVSLIDDDPKECITMLSTPVIWVLSQFSFLVEQGRAHAVKKHLNGAREL